MKLAITGKESAPEKAPFVLRGPYETIIPKAGKMGYDAIELHIHDSAAIDRAKIRKLMDEAGITLSSIGTGSAYSEDRISLSNEDASVREQAIKRLEMHMDTAKEYDAVVIVGLIKGLVRDCSSRDVCIRNLSESLTKLVKKAEADRVPLVLEVINRYESDFLTTIEETLDFLAPFNSEQLLLHIDTFHMNIEQASIPDSIRRAKGKIGHCHVADSDRWYVGHGHYDFAGTIQALRDIGYDRALAVESLMYPDSDTSAEESLKSLRSLVGE
ncbi:MAG: sugar phosphate isomerase/epimerase [Planctomycetaceae bacterium]|nr:sugar phosphate isomerase/epimerase [Planctomycetaceae bacterium]